MSHKNVVMQPGDTLAIVFPNGNQVDVCVHARGMASINHGERGLWVRAFNQKEITVLVIPVEGEMEIRDIDDTLEAKQAIVGGFIQYVPFVASSESDENKEPLEMWCHEEGKLEGLKANRKATFLTKFFEIGLHPDDVVVGDVFFTIPKSRKDHSIESLKRLFSNAFHEAARIADSPT